jgi:hypothetical protein
MADESMPHVLSIAGVSGTATIDHGNTVVVRCETAEGADVALLIPRALTVVLMDKLSAALPQERTSATTK